jgi:hypothetical protein
LWNAIRIDQTRVAKNIFESESEDTIKVEGPGSDGLKRYRKIYGS